MSAISPYLINQIENGLKQNLERLEELKSSQDEEIEGNIFETFLSKKFTGYSDVMRYLKSKYGKEKDLIHNPLTSRGPRKVDLICSVSSCCFRISCFKRNGTSFFVDQVSTNLHHGMFDLNGNIIGVCDGIRGSSMVC